MTQKFADDPLSIHGDTTQAEGGQRWDEMGSGGLGILARPLAILSWTSELGRWRGWRVRWRRREEEEEEGGEE